MEKQIEELAKEFINDQYSFFTEDTRNKMVLSFCEGYKTALSKAEDKGEQTYGEFMRSNPQIPKFNLHPESSNPIATDRTTIAPQPTNSLDELERWVNGYGSDFLTVDDIRRKIQSLKQTHVSDTNVGNINGWISVKDRLPEIITGKDYSENVIVWLNDERKIMNYALLADDNNNLCYVWCMVYDGLDGDAEFDDNYYPTHWQPLPPKP